MSFLTIWGQKRGIKIGSCRVSTEDPNPDLLLAALKRAGCQRIGTEKASGAHVQRPQLTTGLPSLHAGDVLVVWKLDRLGRSLHALSGLLDDRRAQRDRPAPLQRSAWLPPSAQPLGRLR